jgi:Right handed beta helix region
MGPNWMDGGTRAAAPASRRGLLLGGVGAATGALMATATAAPAAAQPEPDAYVRRGELVVNAADYPSIQAALDAAAAGATVLVPRGTYDLTAPLHIPDRVTLRGDGHASLLRVTSSIAAIAVAGGVGVRIADLSVQNAATTGDTTAGLIVLQDGGDCRVTGCRLVGGRYGVVLRDQVDSLVLDNVIVGQNGRWAPVGVYLSSVAVRLRGCLVRGNVIGDVTGMGILCEFHHTGHEQLGLRIAGNHVRNVTDNGIRVQTRAETATTGHVQGGYAIADNTVVGVGGDGIRINGYRATVTGNLVQSATGSGIRDGGGGEGTQWTVVRDAVIAGNTIVDAARGGILLQNGSHHNTINGNVIRNAGSYGILLGEHFGSPDGPSDTSIVGNVVDRYRLDGIKVTGPRVRDVVVSDNLVHGTATERDGVSLRVPDGSGMVVMGNRCRGMQHGVWVQSTNTVVVGNNLRGCTANPVLGEGHTSNQVGLNLT